MIRDMGYVEPGTTLYIPFHTFDSNDPSASVTLTGLATTDIEIYKDGSTTQRASDNGYALLDTDGIDFDGITGIHGISINLADNSTAGFYAAGSQYWVVISSVTVDGATINFVLATFRIGYQAAILNTTIASLSSQTSFTLTNGPAEDDAINGSMVLIHDVASAVQKGYGVVSDYTGSTKTVALLAGTTFTAAATDNIAVFPPVNASHAGAVAYTPTRGLAGTALPNAAADAAGGLPISDAGGLDLDARMDAAVSSRMATYTQPTGFLAATFPGTVASTTNITAGTITTVTNLTNAPTNGDFTATMKASINTEADTALADYDGPTNAEMVARTIVAANYALEATLTSMKGATFDTSTDSLEALRNRGDAAWVTATGFSTLDAAGVRSAVGLASANLDTQLADIPTVSEFNARTIASADYATAAALATVDDFLDTEIATIISNLATVDTVVDAIKVTTDKLDDTLEDSGGGAWIFTVDALANAPSGGGGGTDWSTTEKNQIRFRLGLDGSTATPTATPDLATQASVNTIDDFLDTEVAAIKAKTDALPSDPADQSAVEAAITAATSPLATAAALAVVDDFLDTEVAAIKAKTDALPTDPADQSAVEAAITAATSPLATAAALATVDDFLDTEIAAIKAKTDLIPTDPAETSDIPSAAANAAAVFATLIHAGFSFERCVKIIAAAVAGKTTSAGDNPEVFRDLVDGSNMLSVTNNADGDRSAITYGS